MRDIDKVFVTDFSDCAALKDYFWCHSLRISVFSWAMCFGTLCVSSVCWALRHLLCPASSASETRSVTQCPLLSLQIKFPLTTYSPSMPNLIFPPPRVFLLFPKCPPFPYTLLRHHNQFESLTYTSNMFSPLFLPLTLALLLSPFPFAPLSCLASYASVPSYVNFIIASLSYFNLCLSFVLALANRWSLSTSL